MSLLHFLGPDGVEVPVSATIGVSVGMSSGAVAAGLMNPAP